NLLLHLERRQARLVGFPSNLVVLCGLGFEMMNWLERLAHGGGFQRAGAPNERAPDVGGLNPVSLQLWFDCNAPPDNGAKRHHRTDRDIIGPALPTIPNIPDP